MMRGLKEFVCALGIFGIVMGPALFIITNAKAGDDGDVCIQSTDGKCDGRVHGEDEFTLDTCTVHFSPQGGTIKALVDYIWSAKQSVRVLAYNFTSKDVAAALVAARARGVDVQVMLDRSARTEKNSQLPTMLKAGIPTYIDSKHHIAHNKVILVDGEWIETGSFNYTDNAEKFNGENALICHGGAAYKLYDSDWENHKKHSTQATGAK